MSIEKLRYFIFISYRGTNYHGWQLQPNSITVQKILDEALSTILEEEILTTGAGRTDTGVHASFFCAHFDSSKQNLDTHKNLIFRLNRYLPKDISVNSIQSVIPDAHARFGAISRTYRYYITRVKDPFMEESAWFIHGTLDVEKMNMACRILMEYEDFTSFARLHSDNKTNICRISRAEWTEDGDTLIFTIKADRFLRNMVRAIVGTMVETGMGKLGLEEFRRVITDKDRGSAGKSAPAKGLFLTNVEYPAEIFTKNI